LIVHASSAGDIVIVIVDAGEDEIIEVAEGGRPMVSAFSS
jgi:hypothetical protein